MLKVVTSGKRKRALARAILIEPGEGKITINDKSYKNFHLFDKLKIEEPIKIAEPFIGKITFDVKITANGGGEKGQIEASRLALAKAIYKFTKNEKLKRAYLDYDRNLLIADVRRKEAYKPGDSKARRKRQTSYR